ncbi:MAG: hypothetical protein J2P55_16335 [Rhizobiales bacterium]|nr:hypothetical protein [Hyphomicrobiales bacterium]
MKNVPIPDRMRYLPRDKRGLPIPFIVFRDDDGTPHFTINDEQRRRYVLARDRCAICNHALFRGRWYVGGPKCAFDPRGAYLDPPMHHECAIYALKVCPFLAAPRYGTLIDGKTLDPDKAADAVIVAHDTDTSRPEFFVAVMALGHKIVDGGCMVPKRPFRRIEFWRHGECLAIRRGDVVNKHDFSQATKLRDFLAAAGVP